MKLIAVWAICSSIFYLKNGSLFRVLQLCMYADACVKLVEYALLRRDVILYIYRDKTRRDKR